MRAEIAHPLLFSCGVFSAYENKAAVWLLVCTCGVIGFSTCFKGDHLSRGNEPLVRMSAICLKVWTLIWVPGSKFVQSNNHSRFTRWVRKICLMDGVPPLMILITASLSSKSNKDARWLETCAFGNHMVNTVC